MPVVNIDTAWLTRLLGRDYAVADLAEALEQIGCDVEEIAEIGRYRCPACGAVVEGGPGVQEVKVCSVCGAEADRPFEPVDSLTVIRLDLLAARPDLFDVGGLARALRGFLRIARGLPPYTVAAPAMTVRVDPALSDRRSYRPFIRCALVTIPAIGAAGLVAIMKLQENLHWGVGRDRKLASIGIYDARTLTGEIRYTTIDPDRDRFVPLGKRGEPMTGRAILQTHPKGQAYAHLLEELERFPVLVDEAGQVLAMPPIINSEETKLTAASTRLFIDVTGISEAAVVKTLNTLVCSLAELGGRVEAVTHLTPTGGFEAPDLRPGRADVHLASAGAWLGVPIDAPTAIAAYEKMRLDAVPSPDNENVVVSYPAFRTDIRHMVDLFEDLAIGLGYGSIEPRLVRTMTVAAQRPIETLSERVRWVLLGLGFVEIFSLPLTTEEDHFVRFRLPVPEQYPRIANPKLKALKVVRTHLGTGLLEALHENRKSPMPLRLFEIENVVALDRSAETGTREERRAAFVEMGPQAGFASARSVLDAILFELGGSAEYRPLDHPSFITGRAAQARAGAMEAVLGELHPEVLTGELVRPAGAPPLLDFPVAYGELTLDKWA